MRALMLITITVLLILLANTVQAGSDVRSPNYWRESPNRWQREEWQQSPVNNRNAPYRWQYGDRKDSEEVDIRMDPEGVTDEARQKDAPQTATDTDESSGESAVPPEGSPQKGPRVVEVENGDHAAHDKYSSRALPVIRVQGAAPSAATQSSKTFTERSSRPKHLNGFTVYGLQP